MTRTVPLLCLALIVTTGCGGGGGSGSAGTTGGGGGGGSGPWTIETADSSSADVGVNPSLAVSSGGTVHLSYLDRTNRTYRYARRSGGAWTRSEVASSQGPYSPYGEWSSIGVDSAGVPVVSYHQADVAYFLARGNAAGTSWTKTQIPFSEAAWAFLGHNALAVDPSSGVVHVGLWLYASHDGGYLPGYWKSGDTSSIRVDGPLAQVNVQDNGIHTAIALDKTGRPHLSFSHGGLCTGSYCGGGKTYVAWAEPSGAGWTIHDIEEAPQSSMGPDEKWTAIAIDSAGHPHLFYDRIPMGAGIPTGYRYATWSGSAWTIETVDTPPSSGLAALALALDSAGVPHVAFYKADHVYYAKRTGPGTWASEAVDTSTDDTGHGVAIAVDGAGHVHIAYRDDTAGTLKYATR